MILEPASDATLQSKQRVRRVLDCSPRTLPLLRIRWYILQAEQNALGPSVSEKAMLNAGAPQPETRVKKRKGPKGPNPLSVKKKTPKHRIQQEKNIRTTAAPHDEKNVDTGKKRKREEAHGGSGSVSVVETEIKPKRRRTRQVEAV
jgi:U3 small nucleolar RNA-associated protein 23